ncbi:unnamed protein product, partial [Brassica oleracea var. botrytis]
EQKGSVRWATLDRTRQLNVVISSEVVLKHAEDLETWEKDDNAKLIISLIIAKVRVYSRTPLIRLRTSNKYRGDGCYSFMTTVRETYYHLSLESQSVSLVLAMTLGGGGAPLMLPAKFSVVTEYTDFATPEANFGFHIECGFSYIHSRLPGHLDSGDTDVVRSTIEEFSEKVDLDKDSILNKYAKLGIKHWGVRALTIAKDNCPRWNPATLDEVDDEKIKLVFKPLEDDLELRIPETEENRWEGKAETSGFASVRG